MNDRFGLFGGRYVPETLIPALDELDSAFDAGRLEGIIPALETSHAIVWVADNGSRWNDGDAVLICLSGRGDKDMVQVARLALK